MAGARGTKRAASIKQNCFSCSIRPSFCVKRTRVQKVMPKLWQVVDRAAGRGQPCDGGCERRGPCSRCATSSRACPPRPQSCRTPWHPPLPCRCPAGLAGARWAPCAEAPRQRASGADADPVRRQARSACGVGGPSWMRQAPWTRAPPRAPSALRPPRSATRPRYSR